jgi:hypothetical protein
MHARFLTAALLSVALGVTLAGCSRSKPPEKAADKTPAAGEVAPSDAAAAPATGDATAQTAEVQLAGTLGCGHCVFHVTSDCAACVKTASGDVYVIDGVQEGSDLWEKRLEGTQQIAVSGAVLGSDKVKHIAMTSFELK